ncbi:type II toxin-antitoxin system PemK/MazF family toxin [Facilibium subflavum]|uniref:type II toxin-antitoxin system PemK/MazF family toxin n=1 Tax=Facilibium subflavum TaxID=2219058 RepID=UPI000E64B813|nr:type II toxin-antitoxin system PemK/MazF family toxin [Facilibium subflavum]
MTNYPKVGDIIWLDLEPQAGKEPRKRRPFLVLSDSRYNNKVGLIIGCPITSQIKGYPFEVALPVSSKTKGVVLSDHVKSMDFNTRNYEFIEHIKSSAFINEVKIKIKAILKI